MFTLNVPLRGVDCFSPVVCPVREVPRSNIVRYFMFFVLFSFAACCSHRAEIEEFILRLKPEAFTHSGS